MNKIILFVYLTQAFFLFSALKPNALFSDHAVLQQGVEVPVWGKANEGDIVTVKIQDQTLTATTERGKWMVRFKVLKPGGPFTLSIQGEKELLFQDIYVGETWLCSGQSNMERHLGLQRGQQPLENWEKEVATANYPLIRHFLVSKNNADTPLDDVQGKWVVCSPQTAADFTAVGYYFGRDLHQKLQVPVGLIHSSWGGTRVEAWTRSEVLTTSFPEVSVGHQRAIEDYADALEKNKKELEKGESKGLPPPVGYVSLKDPSKSPSRPSNLYNAMIAPLLPYAIRGVIWYQGETNRGNPRLYRKLFPAMIADWRFQWGGKEFPFLFVQVAPFKDMNPEIREAQFLSWKNTPKTSMVVTTDIGDENDIHPSHKEPVGQRLALAARALAYGESIEYSGPVFESVTFNAEKATITFSHEGKGLTSKMGALQGFEIAGSNKKYYPAEATSIGKSTIVVSNPEVTSAAYVRYGWSNVPDVNLYNEEGLPASPFRSEIQD